MRVRDCAGCNGTGIDETDVLGQCVYCNGAGQVDEHDDEQDDCLDTFEEDR